MPETTGLIKNEQDNPVGLSGYEPERVDVTRDMTVQGQIEDIINANSPLMTQAETRAKKEMNRKGLLNSSIAVGAAEDALIRQALPIASQDAGTHYRAGEFNANTGNQANQFTATQQNQGIILQEQGAQQRENIAATGEQTRENIAAETESGIALEEARHESDMELQEERGEQAFDLANIEGNYQQLLQASTSASAVFQSTVDAIARINASPDIPSKTKKKMVQQQLEYLNAQLEIIGSIANLDIADLLVFE